jgi:uncharacterized membrane protein
MVAVVEHNQNDGLYSVDIRLFLVIITLTMTISFMAGIYGVTDSYYNHNSLVGLYYETMAIKYLFPNLVPSTIEIMTSKDNYNSKASTTSSIPNTTSNPMTIEEQHNPSGQHLLVDIKGVDSDFLNSEERLSKALVDTVKDTGYVNNLITIQLFKRLNFLSVFLHTPVFFLSLSYMLQ